MNTSKPIFRSIENYNDEPIEYCNSCLSLKLMESTSENNQTSICYCAKCGSVETEKAHITVWEKLYEEKYKESHLNNK